MNPRAWPCILSPVFMNIKWSVLFKMEGGKVRKMCVYSMSHYKTFAPSLEVFKGRLNGQPDLELATGPQ